MTTRVDTVAAVTKHNGRWFWAWIENGRWTAPTPSIGGAYIGSKTYCCSGAAVSRARRRDLVRWLMADGYDRVETVE